MDTDNSVVVTRGQEGWEDDDDGKGDQIHGDRVRLDSGW